MSRDPRSASYAQRRQELSMKKTNADERITRADPSSRRTGSPSASKTRKSNTPMSPPARRPNNSSAPLSFGHHDMLSTDIFRHKMQSLMQVREQIEVLAQKHKADEEAMNQVVNSMMLAYNNNNMRHDDKSQQELVKVVEERDQTIQMLAVFRKEGNAVIHRMHESLKQSHQTNEQLLKEIDDLKAQLTAAQSTNELSTTSAASTMETPGQTEILERRCSEYHALLQEADESIKILRQQNEQLQTSQNPSSPSRGSGDLSQASFDDLKDQLRREKQARLEAEEQSHKMITEQQRNIALMEQRLSQLKAQLQQQQSKTPPTGTPRRHQKQLTPKSAQPEPSPPTSEVIESPPREEPSTTAPEPDVAHEKPASTETEPQSTSSPPTKKVVVQGEQPKSRSRVRSETVVGAQGGRSVVTASPEREDSNYKEEELAGSGDEIDSDHEESMRQLEQIERELAMVTASLGGSA